MSLAEKTSTAHEGAAGSSQRPALRAASHGKSIKRRAITMRAAASFLTRRLKASAAATASSAKRGMASGSHGHGHGKEYPFGMHFHVSPVHKNLALAYGTMLWLWVFYRAKEDGRVVLGLEHPWDHGHGHDDHHGDHHGDAAHSHGKIQYARAEIGERPSLVAAEEDDE